MTEENEIQTSATSEEATTVGMFLKYTRLKQKKSIETVSEALCIRKIYIKALEEDNTEELPPVPYGIGFVRSYATYLGLNADRVVQFYKQQMIPQKEKSIVQTVVKKHTPATMPTKRHIYIGLLVLAVLYALWLVGSLFRSNEEQISQLNNEPLEVVEVLPAPEDEQNTPSDVPSSLQDEQITVSNDVYEEPEPVKQPLLKLKVKDQSWIEVKDADKVYVSGVKNKGFTFEIELKEGMQLSIGKYYNVETYLDDVLTPIASPKKQTKINLDAFLKH